MDQKIDLSKRVSAAWQNILKGQQAAAIKEFEQILAEDKENLDALYGLGLAHKNNGDVSGAKARWERAMEVAKAKLVVLGNERTLARERVFMSSTMLQQRLQELA